MVWILIVDDREPDKIFNLLNKNKIKYEKQRLDIGDFVEEDVCIERKEINDFISSIIDGRIFKQVEKMVENYRKCLIVISGKYDYVNSRLPLNVVLASIASIIARNNISIVSVDNDSQLITLINYFIKKATDGQDKKHDFKIKKVNQKYNINVRLIASIPSVGLDRATNILKKYKSIKEISSLDIEKLVEIPGIGKKTAEKILSALN